MFESTAEIIADSLNNCTGDRITTFVLTYPRIIHCHMMTHRVFSRNSSSSRAIPAKRMIAGVIEQQVEPIYWGKNQKGMQAKEELDSETKALALEVWNEFREQTVTATQKLIDLGVHKQTANRLLELFSTVTIICTATEYQNFFSQRCHPAAQPEIQDLAYKMREAYSKNDPQELDEGDWHLPYSKDLVNRDLPLVLKVCTGRAARVSYLNHDGIHSIPDDIRLHDDLVSANPKHLSPFEHCAQASRVSENYANFQGWQSYRNKIEIAKKFQLSKSMGLDYAAYAKHTTTASYINTSLEEFVETFDL